MSTALSTALSTHWAPAVRFSHQVLGDLFESVAAAVLLDGGPDAARVVLRRLMAGHMA